MILGEIEGLLLTHFADVTLNPFWFPTAEKHRYKHSCSPVSQTLDFQRLSRISESLLLSNAPHVFDTAQQAHLQSLAMGCVWHHISELFRPLGMYTIMD